ncbi:MAG: hypothetical protein RBS86_01645 [Candidatus Moranbacteria bacterium]|nr:hypothetical protein [Candidatus Moranbacteria bacterium]
MTFGSISVNNEMGIKEKKLKKERAMAIKTTEKVPVKVSIPEKILSWRRELRQINETSGVFLFGERLPLQKGELPKLIVGKEDGPLFSLPKNFVKTI